MSAATDDVAVDPSGRRGRNRVTARALDRVVRAVTADELGVDPSGVSAELADAAGQLTLTVRTAIRTVSLAAIATRPELVARSGGSLLARAESAQAGIRTRVTELSGAEVSRVVVHLTRPTIRREERVR